MRFFSDWIKKHLHVLTLALIIALLLGLFSSILEDIYEKNSAIVSLDSEIALKISTLRTQPLNDFFLIITQLGNFLPFVLAFIFSLFIFLYLKKYNQLITILLTVFGSALITFVIKNIVQRVRPIDGLIVEHGFSFPSAHAFLAVCFWAVLFYLISGLIKQKALKLVLFLIGITLALLIGFSRVYIGVHWTSDVVASYLLSSVYAIIVIWMVENKHKIANKLGVFSS